LDYAKRHLTHTITSLRRLAMLTAAVDDLEQVGSVNLQHVQTEVASGSIARQAVQLGQQCHWRVAMQHHWVASVGSMLLLQDHCCAAANSLQDRQQQVQQQVQQQGAKG
jgi:hypothetical protein